jgi:hypothetical protein
LKSSASKITGRHGPSRKHSLSIIEKACFPRRLIATVAAQTTQKHRSSIVARICFSGNAFTEPLLRNGLHSLVVLLSPACILRVLHSNGRCLQNHRLATGLYYGYSVSSLQKLFTEIWITVFKTVISILLSAPFIR